MGQGMTSGNWYVFGKKRFTQTGFNLAQKSFKAGDMDVNLANKTYMVTGANSGIGKEISKFLAQKGGTVIMVCRNASRAEKARGEIVDETKSDKVHVLLGDCSLEADVRRFMKEFKEKHSTLDGLVCNAGALFNDRVFTTEGVETTFACHLLFGTFLLTKLAMPMLEAAEDGRVVLVSSGGMYNGKFPKWETAAGLEGPYNGNLAYIYAKRGQVLLAEQWAKQYPKVCFASCHPGWASTPGVDSAFGDGAKWLEPMRTSAEGADGMNWLLCRPASEIESGAFYLDRSPQKKHIAGPFMTAGSATQNTPAEVEGMMTNLEQWLDASKRTLPEFWLHGATLPAKPDVLPPLFQSTVLKYVMDVEQWTSAEAIGKIEVWSRKVPSAAVKGFRFKCALDAKLEQLEALLHTDLIARHKEWNATFKEGRMLEERSADAQVQQWVFSSKGGWDRLFVVAHQRYVLEDGSVLLLERSVKHPDADDPAQIKAVLSEMMFNFRLLKTLENGQTQLIYANVTDVGGWIPAWLVNKANPSISTEEIGHIEQAAGGKQTPEAEQPDPTPSAEN